MGASESIHVLVYNKIGNGKHVMCSIDFTDQKRGPLRAKEWLKDDPHGDSPLMVRVDEHQWPGWSWMPVTYGVGTGFSELTITIICGMNYIRLNRSEYWANVLGRNYESKIGRFVMFVYEDGLRVGPEPTGWIFKRGTERRTLHPWKPLKSRVSIKAVASGRTRTEYVLDDDNNVFVVEDD